MCDRWTFTVFGKPGERYLPGEAADAPGLRALAEAAARADPTTPPSSPVTPGAVANNAPDAPYVPPFVPGEMAYMCYQLEVAPTTGARHWQGYVRFFSRKRRSTVKRLLGAEDAHLEKPFGTEEQNKTYCSKEGGSMFSEFGTYDANQGKGQGYRSDLEAAADMIKAGAHLNEVASKFSTDYIRYHGGFEALALRVAPAPPVRRDVLAIVLWGPTGVGKTHRMMSLYPEAYQVEPGRDPWGHYTNQDVVVFDEFDYSKWTIQQMNRFLDVWRCLLDARYHNRFAAWTRVAILANCSPLSWWPEAPMLLIDSFRRRIRGNVFHVTSREQRIEEMEKEDV